MVSNLLGSSGRPSRRCEISLIQELVGSKMPPREHEIHISTILNCFAKQHDMTKFWVVLNLKDANHDNEFSTYILVHENLSPCAHKSNTAASLFCPWLAAIYARKSESQSETEHESATSSEWNVSGWARDRKRLLTPSTRNNVDFAYFVLFFCSAGGLWSQFESDSSQVSHSRVSLSSP